MKKEGSGMPHAVRVLCIKIGAVILCTALIAAALLYTYKQYEKYKFTALSALISSELMYCAELTTVKAVYSDVVTLKRRQVLGLAKSYSIVRYSGVLPQKKKPSSLLLRADCCRMRNCNRCLSSDGCCRLWALNT